jgi:hypothetical protein
VVQVSFDPRQEVGRTINGEKVQVIFSTPPALGEKITADLLVEDEEKNTLNLLVPFRARNDRVPQLSINEIRTEYDKKTCKAEFVELKALSDGNLGAIRLFIAGISINEPVFEFPPAEVKKGDYIVVHLRVFEEEVGKVKNETGTDLRLSKGKDDYDQARDFWVAKNKKVHKNNAIWLLDQDDRIIDGVILSEDLVTWGTIKTVNTAMEQAVQLFSRQQAWLPKSGNLVPSYVPQPEDAVWSKGSTTTQTICRDETRERGLTNNQGYWYVSTNKKCTPGYLNDPARLKR